MSDEMPDLPDLDQNLMSNFDHGINAEVAERLKQGDVRADYPGMNFWASCWYTAGQYHAAVWQYRQHVATMAADTPELLMDAVCAEYGDE